MAKAKQYLRVHIGEAVFLLPGASGYAVEQRENLSTADTSAPVVAWRKVRNRRLPAYALGGDLKPAARDTWQRAVFIESAPGDGAGIVADDVHLLAEEEVTVASFEPLGPPPTPAGHVFGGAWIADTTPGMEEVERRREQPSKRVVLVFEPRSLVAYLQTLGGV